MASRCQRVFVATALQWITILPFSGAFAGSQMFLGTEACTKTDTSPYFSDEGNATNSSTSLAYTVFCGITQDKAQETDDDLRVYYWDPNSAVGVGTNVICRAQSINADYSSIVFAGDKYGCSTVGGCTSDPGAYLASGYIEFLNITTGGAYATEAQCLIPVFGGTGVPGVIWSLRLLD